MDPPEQSHPQHQVEHGRQPAPVRGKYGPGYGSDAADRFVLETKEDVFVGGHELHPVHVHDGRSRFLRIGHDNFLVYLFGVELVDQKNPDDTQNQSI